ncbi:MAG: amidophosphoribosyltransferase [Defluviitaleaceae bacterium]|nr:amidophosphoribosyltransferase [Defluviitaleaceae bacterium]
MGGLREECGIIGVYSTARNVTSDIFYGLVSLQHRGQESCGIAVTHDREINHFKDVGLVNEVFNGKRLRELSGHMGIGHVRYSTYGTESRENNQPLVLRYIKGALAIAHNGNLVNSAKLRKEFEQVGAIYQTTCDAEVIAYAIARERMGAGSIEKALCMAMHKLKGAYSMVLTSPRKMIAVKDPWGFRPLCMGFKGDDIVFASESAALDCLGARYERELDPGEIVVVEDGKAVSIRDHCGTGKKSVCVFEYIYFARPDSVIDGQLVNNSRRLVGKILAQDSPADADVVIGVPETGIPAAVGYARELNLPYEEGFVKNRYITRTFIKPDQSARSASVILKLNPIKEYIRGKRVCLVDDSLVRGTTMQILVKALRDAGATEVHVRICSPPFLWPCYFGTNICDRGQLAAATSTEAEMARNLGADSLAYLRTERLPEILPDMRQPGFCNACFTGKYPIES